MRLEGSVVIGAPRDEVWAFLLDPDRVASCLPGVESIERLEDGRFRASARIGAGFFSTKVAVTGTYTEVRPPTEMTIVARGSAHGSSGETTARIVLRDGEAGDTVVDWTAEVTLGGMIAAFEGRLADGTAERLVAEVFGCIRSRLEA